MMQTWDSAALDVGTSSLALLVIVNMLYCTYFQPLGYSREYQIMVVSRYLVSPTRSGGIIGGILGSRARNLFPLWNYFTHTYFTMSFDRLGSTNLLKKYTSQIGTSMEIFDEILVTRIFSPH